MMSHDQAQANAVTEAGPKDIFCDLGCGWGQNLIVALTEFDVAGVIGIKKDVSRKQKCEKRLRKWQKHLPSLKGRWSVVGADFDKVLSSKIPNNSFGSLTIVFYGLTTEGKVVESIGRHLTMGCRLVYYLNSLFPEIMPIGLTPRFMFQCTLLQGSPSLKRNGLALLLERNVPV